MPLRDLLRYARKNLGRHRLRSVLTALGVAFAVFLLTGIEGFAKGLDDALTGGDAARTLIVYRKNRWCPQTSKMPERYTDEIAKVSGVSSVLPVKVYLNNCRTNLDMIVFHGAPVEELLRNRSIRLLEGSREAFLRERDAALVGRGFAERRDLKVGDKFAYGQVTVKVSGIFAAEDPTEEELILVHLEFLQRAEGIKQLGTVTQFEVRIDDPSRAGEIAAAIDQRFADLEEPTFTRSRSAFLARATRELREILRFGRLFGLACVLVVVVLVGNTIAMSVHERRREIGVLRAIGFRAPHLLGAVLLEAGALAFAGGAVGALGLLVVLTRSGVAVGVEGVQIAFSTAPAVLLRSFGIALCAALAAGAVPALMATRREVVRTLRSGG